MANYYGQSRTNYFKVKNIKKLEELVKKYGLEMSKYDDNSMNICDTITNDVLSKDGRHRIKSRKTVVLWAGHMSDVGELDEVYDKDEDDYINLTSIIQELLCDDEVCIITHVGSEKVAYFDAYMYIITPKEIEYVALFSNEITMRFQDGEKTKLNKHNRRIWG